jgi:ComF family protein
MALLSGLLNMVYPAVCGICGIKLADGADADLSVCGKCLGSMKANRPPFCERCGRSMYGAVEGVEVCRECRGRRFEYERSWSCLLYEGAAKEALHLLKYSGRLSLNAVFCALTLRFMRENPEIASEMDAVIAVPLYATKLRERRFNQAHILATAVARGYGLEDLSRCLIRAHVTSPQSELDRPERQKNVRDAFKTKENILLRGKNILLADDLFTTGATLNECARVLKEAGAKKIHCLTFARGA